MGGGGAVGCGGAESLCRPSQDRHASGKSSHIPLLKIKNAQRSFVYTAAWAVAAAAAAWRCAAA